MTVTALILAGGRATRLGGIDKRELVIDGCTIFERQVAVLASRVAEIVVSSPREVAGYRTVADAVPDIGPLAGIAAGLNAARTPWLLVVAGDMPNITGPLVDLVLSRIAASGIDGPIGGQGEGTLPASPVGGAAAPGIAQGGALPASPVGGAAAPGIDAIGIRIDGLPEPLFCALRCATCAPIVERRIANAQRKASRLLTDGDLHVCWIDEDALRTVDPELRALFNVNAPDDVVRALAHT